MFDLIKSFYQTSGPRYSRKKALLIVTLSILLISGGILIAYHAKRYFKYQNILFANGTIQVIVQETAQNLEGFVPLQNTYLAEVLNLSVDQPTTFKDFNLHTARSNLLATHVIKEVNLKKIKPNRVLIQYTLRIPLVYIGDYSNTAIDEEGVLFPHLPFFMPRHLPSLYVGQNSDPAPWGKKIADENLITVQKILSLLNPRKIQSIDLSQVNAQSEGKRELIVVLKEGCILRLTPKNYLQQVNDYLFLQRSFLLEKKASMIDLRLPDIAFFSSS